MRFDLVGAMIIMLPYDESAPSRVLCSLPPSDSICENHLPEDTINLPDSPSKMFAEDARDLSPVAIPPPATEKKKRHKGGGQVDHVHE